ncbi:MAG: amidohydrolase family protein, partial [Gammaproteobacteria bacterium]
RTKAKIFGLNAANVYGIDVDEIRHRAQADAIHKVRENDRNDPRPHFKTWGPKKNRREFFF